MKAVPDAGLLPVHQEHQFRGRTFIFAGERLEAFPGQGDGLRFGLLRQRENQAETAIRVCLSGFSPTVTSTPAMGAEL